MSAFTVCYTWSFFSLGLLLAMHVISQIPWSLLLCFVPCTLRRPSSSPSAPTSLLTMQFTSVLLHHCLPKYKERSLIGAESFQRVSTPFQYSLEGGTGSAFLPFRVNNHQGRGWCEQLLISCLADSFHCLMMLLLPFKLQSIKFCTVLLLHFFLCLSFALFLWFSSQFPLSYSFHRSLQLPQFSPLTEHF